MTKTDLFFYGGELLGILDFSFFFLPHKKNKEEKEREGRISR
tara:strand:+ start:3549 stop:3674 length:126 start_codon:yes stop_codon:yes gene_type:complete